MSSLVLLVDDEPSFRRLYDLTLREAGFETLEASSAEQALELLEAHPVGMIVSDVRMPGKDGLELLREVRSLRGELPFLLVTAFAEVRGAVEALRLGAVDYLTKPVDLDELVAAVRDQLGGGACPVKRALPEELAGEVVAESPVMKAVVEDALRVAGSQAGILLTGESGVGKEVLARLIHAASDRAQEKLVAVNCAAIPGHLLGSELFGHVRGAFTGAESARKGKFRESSRGTLFLDEIGDLALDLQPALLRVLETQRVCPLGSDREEEVDLRLVAATNVDLEARVEEGTFRRDLYYRLNVIALEIPPLRERPEDILPLARHFLGRAKGEPRRLSRAAQDALLGHPWPGNIRELANAMQRAQLLAQTSVVLPEHLPPAVRRGAAERDPEPGTSVTAGEGASGAAGTLREIEVEAIRRALEKTQGNRTRAAEELGVTRRGLINKIKRYGL